jgi:hypothetical protein
MNMRSRNGVLSTASALLLAALACHDSGPTSPVAQSPSIPNVAGTWTGTVKSLEILSSGDDRTSPLCPAESVSVDFVSVSGPNSRFLSASIQSGCVEAHFNGQWVAPANQILNGTVTYDLDGLTYEAVLNARLDATSSSRMSATTSDFLHTFPDGSTLSRDSLQFNLTR